MSSSYRVSLDNWLSELDIKADRVLDIGGAQLPLPKRVKSWAIEEYVIADLPHPHANSPKPDVEMDLNLYNHLEPFMYYDIIFCLEVFEYVWDPVTAFTNIFNFLKEGGVAWVSFPAFYPTHNPVEDDSLRYMEGGIRKLADASGLTIKQMIRRRPETNAIERAWEIERMRAAKHYDHHFTGWIVEFTK